jgi:DEAD/DEAH box helicase domain-containing protein
VGWGRIHLPEDTFHTDAYWLTVPAHVAEHTPAIDLETGLVGTAHVLGHVTPLFLMCDPGDIAVWPEVKSPATGKPTVFLYERVPGGIGFSERLYRMHRQVLVNAIQLVARCGCEHGCPSCIGPAQMMEGVGKLNAKMCVLHLLGVLLDVAPEPVLGDRP